MMVYKSQLPHLPLGSIFLWDTHMYVINFPLLICLMSIINHLTSQKKKFRGKNFPPLHFHLESPLFSSLLVNTCYSLRPVSDGTSSEEPPCISTHFFPISTKLLNISIISITVFCDGPFTYMPF